MPDSIKIKNLSVILGGHTQALKNVNLNLPEGRMIGFIGPSGAGKTTLIRAIAGRLKTPNGDITVFESPAGSPELRQSISYMTQELSVYPDLTVRENLKYFATMAGQSRKQARETVAATLQEVDLIAKADGLVRDLSGGQKQRVSLAIALIGSPKLMILDEPTVGLDPVLRQDLWELFKRLAARGRTLVISSHSMDEAERCDDLVLIREGEVVAHDSPAKIRELTGTESIEESFLKLVREKHESA